MYPDHVAEPRDSLPVVSGPPILTERQVAGLVQHVGHFLHFVIRTGVAVLNLLVVGVDLAVGPFHDHIAYQVLCVVEDSRGSEEGLAFIALNFEQKLYYRFGMI